MPRLGAPEIIIIVVLLLLLFGAKRMPDAARGLGRSLRILKSEVKAAQDDEGNSPPQQIQANPDEVSGTPGQQATTNQPTTPAPSSAPQTGGPESGSER